MAKLRFHGVLLLILFLLTLTLCESLRNKGMVATSKLRRSIGKDILPLRYNFKEEDEDCNDILCKPGDADDCDQKRCGKCIEGYNICSDAPPPEDCNDIACTPPTKPEEADECYDHEGCGSCDEEYNVCTSLYD